MPPPLKEPCHVFCLVRCRLPSSSVELTVKHLKRLPVPVSVTSGLELPPATQVTKSGRGVICCTFYNTRRDSVADHIAGEKDSTISWTGASDESPDGGDASGGEAPCRMNLQACDSDSLMQGCARVMMDRDHGTAVLECCLPDWPLNDFFCPIRCW
jgi:hypothetical protein